MESNKLILQTQQGFKSEKHKIFNKEINKFVLSSIDDKGMQSFDLIQTYAFGKRKDLL